MTKRLGRPPNALKGKENREQRIPVKVTGAEKDEIEAAARREGLGASTFMRLRALAAARRRNKERRK